jgi:hypothetical protein
VVRDVAMWGVARPELNRKETIDECGTIPS